MLQQVLEATKDLYIEDHRPTDTRLEGRTMSLMLTPVKAAAPAKPEPPARCTARSPLAPSPPLSPPRRA